jgi:hypothetical protein
MKRFNEDDYWFELGHSPDPTTGRPVRCLVIRCRECKATMSHHAHGMSNERLRKYFMRKHWFVGKTATGHLCPRCVRKEDREAAERAAVPVAVAPPQMSHEFVELYGKWDIATRDQRLEFLLALVADTKQLASLNELLRELGLEIGFIASSQEPALRVIPMPAQPEPVEPESDEPEAAEREPEDDDDVADWWREIEGKTTAGATG